MQLQTFFLVSAALIFSEWRAVGNLAYFPRGEVPVENGKCIFNGTEITPGEPLSMDVPCERWNCSVRDGVTGHLLAAGCAVLMVAPGCTIVPGTGVFPSCCEKASCN